MKKRIILEKNSECRALLRQALETYDLPDCEVRAPDKADAESAVYLWIGEKEKAPPEAFKIKDSDCFYKPLRLGRVLDRLSRYAAQQGRDAQPESVEIGPYVLYTRENRLLQVDTGKDIRLTDKEKLILVFLARHKNTLVDRQSLLDEVWGYAEGLETHTLETHIYRLRQKIEENPAEPALLLTEENGYLLNV